MRGRVVFISNEILIKEITGYAGGLGILSGGLLSSAADIGYPMIGVSFVNKGGYVRHRIENGEVVDSPHPYDPNDYFKDFGELFSIKLKNMEIFFKVWVDKLNEDVSLYFMDTDVEQNPPELRDLTYQLYYDRDEDQKLLRRLLLGLGTLKIVERLGIPVRKYHLNESHCAFLALELLKKMDEELVRKKIVFTTHTPLPHGHEKFYIPLIEKYYDLPSYQKGREGDLLNMSKLLFELSGYVNAVSWQHYRVLKNTFPQYKFDYITNGVHSKWVEEEMRELYDRYLLGWFKHPKKFIHAGIIDLEDLELAREETKLRLIDFINRKAYFNQEFDPNGMLISIRRRVTRYKMNDLILSDMDRLDELGKRYGIQIYLSGTTHPLDWEGKQIIKKFYDAFSVLSNVNIAIFLENGKEPERLGVAGGDLFLHTSVPPLEACGTSWMRAAFNAVPTLTSKTGGVLEVIIHNYNGWYYGEETLTPNWEVDKENFYNTLEEIVKLYNENKEEYLRIARNALKTIPPLFSTNRALIEYIHRAYHD